MLSYNPHADAVTLAPSLLKPLFKFIVSPSATYSSLSSGEKVKVSYSSTDESQVISTEKVDLTDKDKKVAQNSKDYVIRWTALAVYLVVSTPLIVAMVILAATGSVSG